jgi:superfamily I DNA/RNA helicase
MDSTWWINSGQLDDYQKSVIKLEAEGSYLITGPPGSGKTNLLLLRANYLYLAGIVNILVIAYNKNLKNFLKSGTQHYDFPSNKIRTSTSFILEIIKQNDPTYEVDSNLDFYESRVNSAKKLLKIIEGDNLINSYEVILLDESQDYLKEEIQIFQKISKYIFAVSDTNQRIYTKSDNIKKLAEIVDKVIPLKFHYRNGIQICKFADLIGKQFKDYIPLLNRANYDETVYPSEVMKYKNRCVENMIEQLIQNVSTQRKAYPSDYIGVLSPRKDDILKIYNLLKETELSDNMIFQDDITDGIDFNIKNNVICSTIHSAKGIEFRACHLVLLENLKGFPLPRNVCFTGTTRAKTSLMIYHINDLHGFIEQAYIDYLGKPELPNLDNLFTK